MWKALSRISLFTFLLLGIWAYAQYTDNKISTVTWDDINQNKNIPGNYQVRIPKGTAVHPLALVEEKAAKLSVYQYVYLPDSDVASWKEAIQAYQEGDQQPIVDLGKNATQVVIVDTMRFNGQPQSGTPSAFEEETDVVGYVHRGLDHLKANKTEFQSLYGHLPKDKIIVVVENSTTRPSEKFPVLPASGAILAMIAALVFATLHRRSEA